MAGDLYPSGHDVAAGRLPLDNARTLGEGGFGAGLVPPLAEAFVTRSESVPGLEVLLVRGAAVALIPAGHAQDRSEMSGKTQLALHLAEELSRRREADLRVWINATSRASVLSGYMQAAARLGLDHNDDAGSVAARLLSWLSETAQPWLVVLDDLRDPADLDGLRPAGPAGRVLITTADAGAVSGFASVQSVPVPAFSTREAVTYLSALLGSGPDQRSGAIDLAADLGCEPAALAQAAAVIAATGMSCRDYRQSFARRRTQVTTGMSGVWPPASAVTWTLSAELAEQMAPGAWLALVLAAVLDGHGIPADLFTTRPARRYLSQDAARPVDARRAWSGVRALQRAGLAGIGGESKPPSVWVARPVQAVVLAAAPDELISQAVAAAAQALVECWPDDQLQSWPAAQLRSCAASLWRVAGDAMWAGGGCHRVLPTAGRSLDGAGLTGPAVSWWRDLAAACDRLLGARHPDTLTASDLLAGALLADGQAGEAVTCSEWLLAQRGSVLGPEHPATLWAGVSLGRALLVAGKPGDAVAVLDDTARRSDRTLGPEDPVTLAARDGYAAANLVAGNAAEALLWYARLLDASERQHGAADPATVAAMLLLARASMAAGQPGDAIGQYQRAVTVREETLGADHLDTLAVRASLAAAFDAAGQISVALQEHERVCEGYERSLGADHPDTLARRKDLARAYSAAGQLGDAVALLQDSITRCEQALPAGHPLTLGMLQALAGITAEMTGR